MAEQLRSFRIVFRPNAKCEDCGWTRPAGRTARNDGKRHARNHPGHTVIVEVEDRTTYVMPREGE